MSNSIMDSSDIVSSLSDFESIDGGFTIQAELDMLNEANKHKVIMSSDHMDIITDIIPKEELDVKPSTDAMEEDAEIEQAITAEIMDDTISNELMQNVMNIDDRMEESNELDQNCPMYSNNVMDEQIIEENVIGDDSGETNEIEIFQDKEFIDDCKHTEIKSENFSLIDVNEVTEETVIECGQVEDKTVDIPLESGQVEDKTVDDTPIESDVSTVSSMELKTEVVEPEKFLTSYVVTSTTGATHQFHGSFINTKDSKITRLKLPSSTSDPSSGQTIRIVNPGKGFGGAKTITLGDFKKMGLITQSKMNHIIPNTSKQGQLNKILIPSHTTVTVVKSPTKILPAPPASSANTQRTHKVLIRQANTFKPGTIITSGMSGQMIRIPTNQSIQIPGASGKPVQYVKLISSSKGQTLLPVSLTKTVPITISQSMISNSQTAYKVVPVSAPSYVSTTNQQKLYVPVNAVSTNSTTSTTNPQLNSIVMVPSNLLQVKKQMKEASQATSGAKSGDSTSPPPTALSPSLNAGSLPLITKVPQASDTLSEQWSDDESILEANGIRPRKPCNCTKSMCLKLYCDCFANGEFCNTCNCTTCYNNLTHEEERQQAIKACLERNPAAFRPKIGKTFIGSDERRHNKGCNCRRSGCLKNYCECFEAKIPCSKNCKCMQCKNVEGLLGRRPDERFRKNDLLSKSQLGTGARYRQAFNLMTPEVIQATCQCLIAQAEKWDSVDNNMENTLKFTTQSHVIQEFGRCVVQLIECVAKSIPPQQSTS